MGNIVRSGTSLYYIEDYQPLGQIVASYWGGEWDDRRKAWRLPSFFSWRMLDFVRDESRRHIEVSPDVKGLLDAEDMRRRNAVPYQLGQVQGDLRLRPGVELKPFQRTGAAFLLEERRAILADRPGLGKTIESIAAADQLPDSRVLVVARKSILYQWQRSIERFSRFPDVAVAERRSPLGPSRWVVTNYETVLAREEEFARQRFTVVIADEAVALKNPKAKRTRAFARLTRHTPYLWLLTGTPVRNHPKDLWSLLHLIEPERFSSWWAFVHVFLDWWDGTWGTEVGGIKPVEVVRNEIHDLLLPRLLRREKGLLDLPELTEEVVEVPLDPRAEKAYRQMERSFSALTSDGRILVAANTLTQLVRLQQITHDPALCGLPGGSAKTEWILEWMEDHAEYEKAVIFTPFKEYAYTLHKALQKWSPVLITGDHTAKQREEAKRRLNQDDACRVLVGVDKAGGEGLDLQEAADVVIFAGKSWTPDTVEQCIARVYRQGQDRPVTVYSLTAPGTVDEDIEAVLRDKTLIQQSLLDLSGSVERRVAEALAERVMARQLTAVG